MAILGSSDKEVVIKFKVDADGAVSGFEKVESGLDGVKKKTEDTSTSFADFAKSLATGATALAAMGAAAAVALGALAERGDAVNDVSGAFDELSKKAGATADVFLGELQNATKGQISNFELMKRANDAMLAGLKPEQYITVANAAKQFADKIGIDVAQAMDQLSNGLQTGNERIFKQYGLVIDTKKATEAYAASIGVLAKDLTEAERLEATRVEALRLLATVTKDATNETLGAGDALNTIGVALANQRDKLAASVDSNVALSKAYSDLAEAIAKIDLGPFITGLTNTINVSIEAVRAIKKLSDNLNPFAGIDKAAADAASAVDATFAKIGTAITKAKTQAEILQISFAFSKLRAEIMTGPFYTEAYGKQLAELDVQLQMQAVHLPIVANGFDEVAKRTGSSVAPTKEATKAMSELNKELDRRTKLILETPDPAQVNADFGRSLEDAIKNSTTKPDAGGFASNLLGLDAGGNGANIINAFEDVGLQMGQALIDGVTLKSKDFAKLGGQLAGSIANEFLPGSGPIVDLLTQSLFSLFSSESAGTKARKQADKFFADVFDANRLIIVVDGEVQKIKDLVFNGDTFAGGSAFNLFQSLDDDARAAFQGVGAAFESLLGVGEDIGGQLAAVFANNVGGSLNNLQLLVKATGKSFGELSDAIVDAFLDGKLSFKEAAVALSGLQIVMQDGIPGAIGDVIGAFNNLKDAGVKGGRASTDAIRDLAFELLEIKKGASLDDLRNKLLASGAAAEEVDILFQDFAQSGITSITQLSKLTDEQLIPVLANLQDAGFGFKESIDGANELLSKIDSLPDKIEKTLTFNVEANYSDSAKEAVKVYESASGQSLGL